VEAQPRPGAYVLYWMQKAQRASWNPALTEAISLANRLRLPLVVLFVLTDYPAASKAQYRFMLGGLAETAAGLQGLGAAFILASGQPPAVCAAWATDAAALVIDGGRLRIELGWRRELVKNLRAMASPPPLLEIETEAVVPPGLASMKDEWSAATFRRRIEAAIPYYLKPLPDLDLHHDASKLGLKSPAWPDFPAGHDSPRSRGGGGLSARLPYGLEPARSKEQDRLPQPGRLAAMEGFGRFLEKGLDRYDGDRNDPSLKGQSDMSPYLHFGQVSSMELALLARQHGGPGLPAWLEQLIVRRELAVNFVLRNPLYDNYGGLPEWARKSLGEAAKDPRKQVYGRGDLEASATHDPYWNAAQDELVRSGRIHNYMRMYWGKKILEWSPSPEEGFSLALSLNDAYALDGRDPNGYAGVAWCFGKHDRPWAPRPIFGNIRSMTASGLERKFDMEAYLRRVGELMGSGPDKAGD
jgi:deoxyribodipyrimidine photo-lyase